MAVAAKIIVIFIMIGVGFVLNKIKVLPEDANTHISKLVVLVGTPCLLFSAIVQKELNEETMSVTIQIGLATIIFFTIVTIAAYAFLRVFRLKEDKDAGVYLALMTTINGSFMGFPVMKAAFGTEGLYLMVIANMIFNVYLYSFAIIQIKYGSEEKESFKETMKSICNPCTIASLLGFACLLMHVKLPDIIMDPIVQIGDIAVPLSMLSVGISIGNSKVAEIFKNKKLLMVCGAKLLIWPAITFCVVMFTDLSVMVKCVMILMSTLPPAVSTGVIVRKLGRNAKLASEGIILSTMFSVVTIPGVFLILSYIFGL